jgi:hypothetical protein
VDAQNGSSKSMTNGSTNKSREKTCSGLGQESKHNLSLQLLMPHVLFIEHLVCMSQEAKKWSFNTQMKSSSMTSEQYTGVGESQRLISPLQT